MCVFFVFFTVASREQEKRKTQRKSFSIWPMSRRLSNPRRIRWVKLHRVLLQLPHCSYLSHGWIIVLTVEPEERCGDDCTFLIGPRLARVPGVCDARPPLQSYNSRVNMLTLFSFVTSSPGHCSVVTCEFEVFLVSGSTNTNALTLLKVGLFHSVLTNIAVCLDLMQNGLS